MTPPLHHNRVFAAVHTLVIFVVTVAVTFLFGIMAIVFSFFSKTGNVVHGIARIWGRCILWISAVRVHIRGLEQINPGTSYIFMANHLSQFDIPVLLSAMPLQFRWLAKAELFKIPIFGRGMRGAGYISIDRSNRQSAFQSLARAAQIIRQGTSVVIFPEGTRSADGRLQSFKKGGFVLAVDAGVPIIPMLITGTHEIMPKGRLVVRPRRVDIRLLPAVDSSQYNRKTKDELIARLHKEMSAALDQGPAGGPHA